MSVRDNPRLNALREKIVECMFEGVAKGDVVYTKAQVGQCGTILAIHLGAMSDAIDAHAGKSITASTVRKLNKLNREADSGLIGTIAREGICELIMVAGAMRGFNDEGEDITDKWREW